MNPCGLNDAPNVPQVVIGLQRGQFVEMRATGVVDRR